MRLVGVLLRCNVNTTERFQLRSAAYTALLLCFCTLSPHASRAASSHPRVSTTPELQWTFLNCPSLPTPSSSLYVSRPVMCVYHDHQRQPYAVSYNDVRSDHPIARSPHQAFVWGGHDSTRGERRTERRDSFHSSAIDVSTNTGRHSQETFVPLRSQPALPHRTYLGTHQSYVCCPHHCRGKKKRDRKALGPLSELSWPPSLHSYSGSATPVFPPLIGISLPRLGHRSGRDERRIQLDNNCGGRGLTGLINTCTPLPHHNQSRQSFNNASCVNNNTQNKTQKKQKSRKQPHTNRTGGT
jgi:hypothetical protein